MAWGLDGLQLSHIHDATVISQSDAGWITGIINIIGAISGWLVGNSWSVESLSREAFKKLPTKPLYDYYLSDDTSESTLITHDYAGLDFNKEIASILLTTHANNPKAKLNGVQLHQNVESAIAYCYNKNKRDKDGNVCTVNSDGTVNTDNLKWYLPSIDEIEDIVVGAYSEFDGVFQDNMYWSCQPAYDMHRMDLDGSIWGDECKFYADYYTDNINRARATKSRFDKVVDGKPQYESVGSGVPNYAGTQRGNMEMRFLSANISFDIPTSKYQSNGVLDYNSSTDTQGNMLRTATNRIRAVYRSGSGIRNN